jgi:DNA repair protein RadA/Sms
MGVFAGLVAQGHRAIYFTGEETRSQLRLRAKRLNLDLDRLLVVRTEDATEVAATIEEERPDVVIVDSIQTMRANGDTVPGGAASVREVASILQEVGKRTNTTIILIGHVTKESVIAGPKTLEHIVDAVLLLEGERSGSLRRLRSTKNRYGATDETSLFEMRDSGMVGVDSAVPVLADGGTAFGRVICPVFEGSRAMLVEVQALVAKAAYSSARRVAIGVPEKQVSMLLAVLERYADLDLSAHDVYVAVQSGIVVNERAIDAAICAAVASSARSHAIDATTVTLGEVGLNGGVRHVNAMTSRLKEAAKHDFVRAIGPHSDDPKSGLLYTEVSEVRALLDALGLMDGVVVEGRKAAAFWGGRSGRSGSRDESDDD